MSEITISGGCVISAADELLDTIIIDITGKEYIRTYEATWAPYKELPVPVVNTKSRKNRTNLKAASKKPKRRASRPPTAYNIFLHKTLKELAISHPDMLCKDRMQYAASKWRSQR